MSLPPTARATTLQIQGAMNLETVGEWDNYAPHRARVTATVVAALQRYPLSARRLMVLGAGNCNDIELAELAALADETCLLDIDRSAVERALDAHRVAQRGGISVSEADLLADRQVPPELETQYEVILSAGILTQLFDSVRRSNPTIQHLVATRAQHLTLMLDRLAEGGRGLLVLDVVSSLTCSRLLESTPPSELRSIMEDCIRSRNFFSGANPYAVGQHALDLGAFSCSVSEPWLWRIGGALRLTVMLEFTGRAGSTQWVVPTSSR